MLTDTPEPGKESNRARQPSALLLLDDGKFPNNPVLPLLVYGGALNPEAGDLAQCFEALFSSNGWPAAWRNGVFGVHHYHSTAHEVLGVYGGQAELQFGGERGPVLSVGQGDVVVIPAGVAHKNRDSSGEFAVVGAYPRGQHWDTCYGGADERAATDHNIVRVGLPDADPVFGGSGPLGDAWSKSR